MADNTTTADVPPIDPQPIDTPPTRWPKVIGVISIIYAIGGLMCFTLQGAWMGAMDLIPEMWRGGVTMPLALRLIYIALIVPTLILGIMLLTGGIGLLHRKRSAIGLLRKWALLRIIMLLLGVVVMVLTAQAQIDIQRQVQAYQTRMYEQAKRPAPREKSEAEIWRGIVIQTAVFTGLLAAYPLFVGIFLSRKKIDSEVAEWR